MEWIWTNSAKLGELAQAAAAIFAMAAVLVAWLQYSRSHKSRMEVVAYEAWAEQLRIDLQYPELARPDRQALSGSGRLGQYDDYVSHLLYTCENILEVSSASEWRSAMQHSLRPHAQHIETECLVVGRQSYSRDLIRLMEEIVSEQRRSTQR